MASAKEPINFFEIPVANYDRAKKFYEAVTATTMDPMEMGAHKFAFFPRGAAVGGAIVQGEGYTPSPTGSLVYLNAGGDFDAMLERIVKHGGKVVMPRSSIGEFGFIARFIDSEGNLVAMHTM